MTYIFIIDTDSYSGNFERELTAHCTGQVGDCEVGQERAKDFSEQYPDEFDAFSDIIEQRPDEHGTRRPTSIWDTPGYWNDGMGNHWPDSKHGSAETITLYRQTVAKYQQEHPGSLPHLDTAMALPRRFPASQSVAIFFDQRPAVEQIAFMVERARSFVPEDVHETFNLIGFRLLSEETRFHTLWESGINGV